MPKVTRTASDKLGWESPVYLQNQCFATGPPQVWRSKDLENPLIKSWMVSIHSSTFLINPINQMSLLYIYFQLKLLIASFSTIRSVLVWSVHLYGPSSCRRMCSAYKQAVFLPWRKLAKNRAVPNQDLLCSSPPCGIKSAQTHLQGIYTSTCMCKRDMWNFSNITPLLKVEGHAFWHLKLPSLTSTTYTSSFLNEWFPRPDFPRCEDLILTILDTFQSKFLYTNLEKSKLSIPENPVNACKRGSASKWLRLSNILGHQGDSVVERLPLAQIVILESWGQVLYWAPCREPASPSACVSASPSVSLINK